MSDHILEKHYAHQQTLRYGCNPHQTPAAVYMEGQQNLPFRILNGSPGYINLLDALNGWQLVRELREALGLPAATSFKHVSPAGAAVASPLTKELAQAYEVQAEDLSPLALAYVRARGADPMSSFGDFAALSDEVDESTAQVLKREVSDGVIAPGYTPKALEILKSKKGGNYVVLEMDSAFKPPPTELKEVFGVVFSQQRNDVPITADILTNRVTNNKTLTPAAEQDLILAAITLKYTQSNSVGYALDGQMVGVGAGQQSRVDCTKLAGRKVDTWYLRQSSQVLSLPFRKDVRRVDRINARVRYIEGDFTPNELQAWYKLFDGKPELFSADERKQLMTNLSGVSLASDAFFPFRDSIDQAAPRGVKYIVQPGGSIADEGITAACDEYGMVMAFSGIRLFHH